MSQGLVLIADDDPNSISELTKILVPPATDARPSDRKLQLYCSANLSLTLSQTSIPEPASIFLGGSA
jgi:hypothetical protein